LWQLRKGTHGNAHLQAAFKEYGEACFKFDVIEEVDDDTQLYMEQWWLNNTYCLDPKYGYNIAKDAVAFFKGMSHSIESRKKISMTLAGKKPSPEHRKKLSVARVGVPRKPHSLETRKRISDALTGKPRKPFSPEHRKRLAAAITGKPRKPFSLETRRKMSDAKKQYWKRIQAT
jgi:group I intron endonuclease